MSFSSSVIISLLIEGLISLVSIIDIDSFPSTSLFLILLSPILFPFNEFLKPSLNFSILHKNKYLKYYMTI